MNLLLWLLRVGFVKTHLRRVAARTSAALDRAIADGPAAISAQDARGCLAHRGCLGKLN